MELELRINGVVADQDVAPNEPLHSLLHRKGYTSVKHGCETGECGACTVLVDGVPRPSCVMLAAQVGGCTLTTVESLGSGDNLHALQTAFIETGAVQCGFCTPGMLVSAYALLTNNPSPTEEEVREALSGNLCRCSNYARPVQAVLRAAALLRGEEVQMLTYNTLKAEDEYRPNIGRIGMLGASEKLRAIVSNVSSPTASVTTKIPAVSTLTTPISEASPAVSSSSLDTQLQVVGTSIPALNAVKMATGRAAFVADFQLQGMLYGRVLTSPHAHAVIRDINVARAKALPGVYAVLTYRDVPRVPCSHVERPSQAKNVQDQYCLDYMVRYVGDRVAAVVAETAEVAEQALQLIEVEYQVLPALLDLRHSSDPKAPRVHPEGEARGILDASRNIAARVRSEIGDVEQGFAASDHVLEAEYIVPATQQVPLEMHTTLTYFDEDDILVVHTNSMIPHHVRRTLAQTLGIPMRRVRVIMSDVGGSFGARQEIVLEDICALLTMATRRPVKLEYSRAEEFRSSSVRQQTILRLKTGVRKDGTILASQMVQLVDTGAYATHALVASQNVVNALSLYPCPNMRFVAEVLYTNHAPAAQSYELAAAFFALESHIDDLARQIGMDALTLRRKNWIRTGDIYPLPRDAGNDRDAGTAVESCGLPTCLQIVEEKLGWAEKRGRANYDRFRRGVGVALSFQGNPGAPVGTSGTIIKLNEDGSFDVFAGCSESGTGTVTLVAQVAAEVLGVSMDDVFMHTADTRSIPFETNVNDFSAFYSSGGAVKKAAEQIRRQILSVAGRMLNAMPETLKMSNSVIKTAQGQQVTIAQVASHSLYVENRQIMTTSSWKTASVPMTFAAQGVEVEVDFETGVVRVLKAISAVDVGNPLNPMLLEGQIQGSATQALSMGLCEELSYDQHGALLTTNLQDYHIFSTTDVPEMQTYLVETNDPSELFGAKSVSTIPFYGMSPAIANAVLDAADIRIRQLPLTPERVLRALHTHMARR